MGPIAPTARASERLYLEDYEVGEVFVSPGRTITETDVVLFASLTGDWHPLHTDADLRPQRPCSASASPTAC